MQHEKRAESKVYLAQYWTNRQREAGVWVTIGERDTYPEAEVLAIEYRMTYAHVRVVRVDTQVTTRTTKTAIWESHNRGDDIPRGAKEVDSEA